MQSNTTESASPGGRRLSRSFHSCLRGADQDDLESGEYIVIFHCTSREKVMWFVILNFTCERTIKFVLSRMTDKCPLIGEMKT